MDDKVEDRQVRVAQIRNSIARAQYQVDAAAVAEAILKRLLEGRTLDLADRHP